MVAGPVAAEKPFPAFPAAYRADGTPFTRRPTSLERRIPFWSSSAACGDRFAWSSLVSSKRHQEEFARRNTRVVAVSLDNREDTAKTARKFPHLVILSDEERGLAGPAEVVGPHGSRDGKETASPTTILIDRRGPVRWVFRPDRFIERLTAEEVLARVDEYLAGK